MHTEQFPSKPLFRMAYDTDIVSSPQQHPRTAVVTVSETTVVPGSGFPSTFSPHYANITIDVAAWVKKWLAPPPKRLGGLLEGVSISDDDIEEVRKEMWQNFPRENEHG